VPTTIVLGGYKKYEEHHKYKDDGTHETKQSNFEVAISLDTFFTASALPLHLRLCLRSFLFA
jgi:hypothetical protein